MVLGQSNEGMYLATVIWPAVAVDNFPRMLSQVWSPLHGWPLVTIMP